MHLIGDDIAITHFTPQFVKALGTATHSSLFYASGFGIPDGNKKTVNCYFVILVLFMAFLCDGVL